MIHHTAAKRSRNRTSSILFNIALLLALTAPALAPEAQAQGPSSSPIVESNQEGLTLTWTPPPYRVTRVVIDGIAYSRLEVEGTATASQRGVPQLPFYGGLIGLPSQGAAELRVLELQVERVRLPNPPLPAPRLPPLAPGQTQPDDMPVAGLTVYAPDPTVYSRAEFYPPQAVSLGPPALARDQRVAALTVYPLRVNPVTLEMEVVRSVRLSVRFTQPAPWSELGAQDEATDAFSRGLAGALLNPEASGWPTARARGGEAFRALALAGGQAAEGEIKVLVDTPGVYVITFSALQRAGVPVATLDPSTYKMSHGYPRQEVAIGVDSNRIFFYAAPAYSRYTDQDAYFLSYGGTAGLRMASRSGDPTGLPEGKLRRTMTSEINHYYDPKYAGRDGDHWYWDKLQLPDRRSASYPIQLDALMADTPATVTIWLQGYTNPPSTPDHRVRFSVNGAQVGEKTWDGTKGMTATFNVPAGALLNGNNQVGLSLPKLNGVLVEGTWVDALSLTYATRQPTGQVRLQGEAGRKKYILTPGGAHRVYLPLALRAGAAGGAAQPPIVAEPPSLAVYDVTQPQRPKVVTGFTQVGSTLTIGDAGAAPAVYLIVPAGQAKVPLALQAVKTLSAPPQGADYIIITHPDFKAAVAPLAARRSQQGLRVVTVDVQAIYDTFGEGRLDPQAIRNFLAFAYSNWRAPAPLYVLLVGDGSYDFRNYSGYDPPTYIPPYMMDVDPLWGETASDNRLVTLSGDDNVPDMLIGRLPVNTANDATTVVDKIIHYETASPEPWLFQQMIVADDADGADNFPAKADMAYSYARTPFRPSRLYLSESAAAQPYVYTDASALKTALLADLNAGVGLVSYFGHSSWLQWAVEDVFQMDNVDQLNNRDRLPIALEMTCFTGFFHHPQYPTLDESLLRRSGGGMVAVWGSTGTGVASWNIGLHRGFYTAARTGHGTTLGAAALNGKLNVWASTVDRDLLDTFTLFGDPAMTARFNTAPAFKQLFLPIALK